MMPSQATTVRFNFHRLGNAYEFELKTVEIRSLSDDELEVLSKQGSFISHWLKQTIQNGFSNSSESQQISNWNRFANLERAL